VRSKTSIELTYKVLNIFDFYLLSYKIINMYILNFSYFACIYLLFYTVFCEITGFNGTTGRIDSEQQYAIDENRKVEVSFFAMTMVGFPLPLRILRLSLN
jgi:cytochrome c oxidase assembly protein Cox11